ncbi:chordin-like protein 1 [Pollicipes pollicipes]|nr:chordin-like protein 1 [Pollicipes pollicipes]
MQDQGRELTPEEVLQAGGCRKSSKFYRNGDQWNPRIVTIGVLPCVVCHCRDRQISCSRKQCPKLTCGLTKKQPGECCDVCRRSAEPTAIGDRPGKAPSANGDRPGKARRRHAPRYRRT